MQHYHIRHIAVRDTTASGAYKVIKNPPTIYERHE